MEPVIQDEGFTLKASKLDYFFGRVQSEANQVRSQQNCRDLAQLGILDTTAGRRHLLRLFQQGLTGPEISRRITPYGLNITRSVSLRYEQTQGEIQVIYFYPKADLTQTPQVVSLIPKIYRT